ncbi:putative protein disulfide-isomerase C1F5.02 [Nosema granulosis]|uniref:protein disulfide-isomerase n=1 Tax=Nosema granulosis TaxID=83296 RepID=A0A9P6L0S2_9MICR|nr:putative protein disulfide-isomerase C1F5.02 [Nosema granulosis]
MKIFTFLSLLLAKVDNSEQKEGSKISMDFFGKQISIFEKDTEKLNELKAKYTLPPLDIVDISKKLDTIVSNPEEELRRGERYFAIYFVDEANALATADHAEENVTVFISTDEELAAKLEVPFPGIYAFSPLDKVAYKIPLEGKTAKNVNAILKTPMIGPISYENFGLYRATEMPLLYLFSKPEDIDSVLKAVQGQVKKCRNVGKFVIIPYDSSRISPDVFGFTEANLPTLVFIKERAKYNLVNCETKDFESFLIEVLEGRAEPFYATQKEPENNLELDVKTITRENLPGFLNDSTKDRLMVFSSPDCGYCRELKPILEEFGKIIKANADDKIFVGACDVTVNDITEFDVAAVPAIFLIKAGSNERVKLEGGDRTLESLIKFIREKGTHTVDLTAFIPKKDEELEKELPIEEPVSEKISDREEL